MSKLRPSGPAILAGVCVGDCIISVNQTCTKGMTVNEVKQILTTESSLNHEIDVSVLRN